MTFIRWNNAEGGTAGVNVSTANSGGASGDAWNTVNIGTGTTLQYSSTQKRDGSTAYHFVGDGIHSAYLKWTCTGVTGLYVRAYFYLTASIVNTFLYQLGGGTGTADAWVTSLARIKSDAGSVNTTGTTVLATNTWYRAESQFILGTGTSQTVTRLYNNAGSLLETISSPATGTVTSPTTIGYGILGAQAADLYMDDLAASDQGWIGDYVAPAGSSSCFFF